MLTALLFLVAATQPAQCFGELPRNTSTCTYTGVDGLVKPFSQTNVDWDSETVPELPIAESNRTSWQRLKNEELERDQIPTKATQPIISRGRSFIDRYHRPWHTAFRSLWHDFELISKVVLYEVSHMPTLREPYYEGFVTPMPNICCRAKSLEQLQDQLLKQYAQYLRILSEYSNSPPLKGPLEGASIAQPALHLPKIQQHTAQWSEEALLARQQRIYMNQFGRDVNFPISNVKE